MFSVHANATFKSINTARMALDEFQRASMTPIFQAATYSSTGMSEIGDEVGKHPGFVDETWHDDKTITKVHKALEQVVDSYQAINIIDTLQNAGILFRERVPE